jgi:hypothetical protein
MLVKKPLDLEKTVTISVDIKGKNVTSYIGYTDYSRNTGTHALNGRNHCVSTWNGLTIVPRSPLSALTNIKPEASSDVIIGLSNWVTTTFSHESVAPPWQTLPLSVELAVLHAGVSCSGGEELSFFPFCLLFSLSAALRFSASFFLSLAELDFLGSFLMLFLIVLRGTGSGWTTKGTLTPGNVAISL